MNILILVVCCAGRNDYEMLADTIKKTWGSDKRVYFLWCQNYKGDDNRDFVIKKEEGYGMLLWKTIAFLFKHRHDEFDYIIRVNLGSYVHIGRLIKYLEDKPKEGFYCGQVGKYDDIVFVSGSCFILSRDLVMMLLSNVKSLGFDHIDDVSIGRFMMKNNITPVFCKTKLRYLNDSEYDENTYHWKLRSPDGERNLDCEKMKSLYNEHYGNIQ